MTEEEKRAQTTIIEAMIRTGMSREDMAKALNMAVAGHDIQFVFLSEDEDNDDLEVMISWLPIPEEARADAPESAYGDWKDVVNSKVCPNCNDIFDMRDPEFIDDWCEEHGLCRMCCIGLHEGDYERAKRENGSTTPP